MGTHWKHFIETLPMSTLSDHIKRFCRIMENKSDKQILTGRVSLFISIICYGQSAQTKIPWAILKDGYLALFRPIEFCIKLHTNKSGWSIVYIEGVTHAILSWAKGRNKIHLWNCLLFKSPDSECIGVTLADACDIHQLCLTLSWFEVKAAKAANVWALVCGSFHTTHHAWIQWGDWGSEPHCKTMSS